MINFINYILQDWQINKDTSFKSRLILLMFRFAQSLKTLPSIFIWIFILYRFFYQIVVEWVLGIELPWDTQAGPNLKLQHGQGLVVNHETIIGGNCILRNSTTIGNKRLQDGSYSASPKIGDNVDIGANVVIIGSITVGNNAVIGAGSVVVKDVPEGAVVVGNPARVIRTASMDSSSIYKEELKILGLASVSSKSKVDNL
ncbi:MAG: serine acetyltransferase [Symplocastrum torsivum CPER-KK1]|jgi:putative colanic acid biosynthesis acetyltransferase WcaB|uniref:Serine acetyltransferase n=1 Tax=Symplocastrum torsivum CPER-KK1 TaxID=450513 RepID=A0A951PJJ5_9CYAN|nr:serine acetyltransferase [Symplocastrum torsivum CPER-KK1]